MENSNSKVEMKNESSTQVIRSFLENVSKEKHIPVERLMTGIMQGDLYVWDYDSGRKYQDQFRVVHQIDDLKITQK